MVSIEEGLIKEKIKSYIYQDCENLGMNAKCKEKSLQKLQNYLRNVKTTVSCEIKLDSDTPIQYVFPIGKTKSDLVAYIYNFFNT